MNSQPRLFAGLVLATVLTLSARSGYYWFGRVGVRDGGRGLVRITCEQNLRSIQMAKDIWMAERKTTNAPTASDLVASNASLLREMPVCPLGGTYTIGDANLKVRCSISDHKSYWEK